MKRLHDRAEAIRLNLISQSTCLRSVLAQESGAVADTALRAERLWGIGRILMNVAYGFHERTKRSQERKYSRKALLIVGSVSIALAVALTTWWWPSKHPTETD